jgi:hypothetical protein
MSAPNLQVTEHPIGGAQGPEYVGGAGSAIGFYQDPYGAVFTATISGTTMTVLSLLQGSIVPGQTLTSANNGQVSTLGVTITSMGTATAQTGAGAIGTWNISNSLTYSTATTFTSGLGAVTQPNGPQQAAVTRGQQAGVIATYQTTQSPSTVNANTTSEKSLTIQSGTGAQMLIATTDLLFVNKPSCDAGIGVGNIYCSASNTAKMNMANFTGSNVTPTSSEAYSLVALRGLNSISATLSPAAVAANTTIEQQFTVSGLIAGNLVQVTKPTNQTGLDIGGCRIVANNLLGITFNNVTGSAITPTAAESYTVTQLAGLDALNNEIMYGFNVGTVGAIGAGVVVSGGATTLTGLLATDMVTGIFDPTAQAAATNAAYPIKGIPTADTLTLYFAGIGSGATPTASEVYGIKTTRLKPAAPLVLYTPSIAPGSVAANTTAEQTFTVTGLVAGSPVWVNKPSFTPGLSIVGCRVSAANTLAITYANNTTAAIVPPTENYVVGNFQVKSPGAGNVVYQTVSPAINNIENLANGLRTALVSTNFIAGA